MGEGEGGMIWENGTETCIISYVKQIASPGSMHDTACLGLVHWDDPEGWDGEGGGRRVRIGNPGTPPTLVSEVCPWSSVRAVEYPLMSLGAWIIRSQ